MAGSRHSHAGNGYNYLCLPGVPTYDSGRVQPGVQADRGYLHHTQYYTPSGPFEDKRFQDVPCAVCLDESHNNVLLYPARNDCPGGWDVEYHGYLMSPRYSTDRVMQHVCVDIEGRVMPGTSTDVAGQHLYPVEVICSNGNSIPCLPYVDGYELTCAVCAI
ncbi:uncharacterized protein [Ptychodera flava]|uniref:uncharacterized protein n=1 Tax=Ptychodera flava TaxID=63121 RepID=UPI00396A924A